MNNLPAYNERLQKAYSIVKTANNKAGLVYDLRLQLGKYPLATRQLMQALDIQEKTGDNRIHYTTDLLSHIYLATGNHKEALRYALASIDYSRRYNDTLIIATFYQRIANVHAALGNYEKAYQYFEKVLTVATPSKTNRAVAIALINSMTTCLLSLRQYQEALDFLSQKLQAFPPVDANTQKMVDRLYLSLYCDLGRYKEAEKCFLKILKPGTNFNFDAQDQVGFLLKGAQLYYHLKQYDQAEYFADSAYRFARHLKAWRATMEASYQL